MLVVYSMLNLYEWYNMASFIICYHPHRYDNLAQTLRFLQKREPDIDSYEFVFVSQTTNNPLPKISQRLVYIDMNLSGYNRQIMLNAGVFAASDSQVVLLDSDRILPHGYFQHVLSDLSPGQVASTRQLFKLRKAYDDSEIERNAVEVIPDHRHPSTVLRRKNLFAGNVAIWKSDYIKLGGMDTAYSGYGYADTDMTRRVERSDLEIVYREDPELHLYHEPSVVLGRHLFKDDDVKLMCAINGIRFCLKWGCIEPDAESHFREVAASWSTYSMELKRQFTELWRSLLEVDSDVGAKCDPHGVIMDQVDA